MTLGLFTFSFSPSKLGVSICWLTATLILPFALPSGARAWLSCPLGWWLCPLGASHSRTWVPPSPIPQRRGPRIQRLRDGSESTQSLRGALNSSQAGSPLPPRTASTERRKFRKARGHFGRLVSAIDRKKSDVSSVSRLTFMPFTSRLLLFACHPA